VRQKLASDNEAVKKERILQALNYGEKGIEALFGVLEQIRAGIELLERNPQAVESTFRRLVPSQIE
jgi:hypothetical protein